MLVRFDGEVRLLDDERPEHPNYATVAQAVQDQIGFSGVKVIEVTEYEDET